MAAAALGACAAGPDDVPTAADVAAPLDRIAWLAGTWTTAPRPADGSVNEEMWLHARAGTMLGVNRLVREEATRFFEYLRIEARGEDLVYLASPAGRFPPTEFTMTERDDPAEIVFENPGHDFPQRIIYRRVDETHMLAAIEGESSGGRQRSEWAYERVR